MRNSISYTNYKDNSKFLEFFESFCIFSKVLEFLQAILLAIKNNHKKLKILRVGVCVGVVISRGSYSSNLLKCQEMSSLIPFLQLLVEKMILI